MFSQWQSTHGKIYQNPEELIYRLTVFYENYLYVTAMNAEEDSDMVLKLNKFSDLGDKEFSALYADKSEPLFPEQSEEIKDNTAPEHRVSQGAPPQNVDWESKGIVPAPRNGDITCGKGLMAFSVTTAMTTNHRILNGMSNYVISAQEFIDCSDRFTCRTPPGTDGIRMHYYRQIIYTENMYSGAKTGKPGTCAKPQVNTSTVSQESNPPYYDGYSLGRNTDASLMEMVGNGIVAVRPRIVMKIVQFYSSGLVKYKSCKTVSEGSTPIWASVIGYDINSRKKKSYWKVRFALGKNWGMNGNMQIQKEYPYEDNIGPCGILFQTYFPKMLKY